LVRHCSNPNDGNLGPNDKILVDALRKIDNGKLKLAEPKTNYQKACAGTLFGPNSVAFTSIVAAGSFGTVFGTLPSLGCGPHRPQNFAHMVASKWIKINDLYYCMNIVRSLMLIGKLGHHKNIAWVLTFFTFQIGAQKYIVLIQEMGKKSCADLLKEHKDVRRECGTTTIGNVELLCLQKMIWDLAKGLAFLHSEQLVHRDVKPSNAVQKHGPDGINQELGGLYEWVDLDDLGHAKDCFVGNGTLVYRAPEVENSNYGCKMDVYSLGVFAFEVS